MSLALNYWEINQTTSKCQIDFWTKLAKKVKNKKSEHRYKTLHIEISLATKFCPKLTLLNFMDQNNRKGYFPTKKKENYHRNLYIQINLYYYKF